MANRSFLIEANTSEPIPRNGQPDEALAASSNWIPMYWFSLFDVNCFVINKVTLHDGRVETYPYLVTPTAQARARCLERRSLLERVTPEPHAVLVEQWLRFLSDLALPFIHLDPAEIWMMVDQRTFESDLQRCIGVFDSPAPAPGPLSNKEDWLEMLDGSGIDPDDLAGTVRPFKLAGYSWGRRAVPWE